MAVPLDEQDAAEFFTDLVQALGLRVIAQEQPDASDLVVLEAAGHRVLVQLRSMPAATPASVSRLMDEGNRAARSGALIVLVADRVPELAREELRRHGWGWLDLRGHLHIAGQGVFIDADVPPARERTQRADAFSGTAGLEITCSLLLRPDVRHGVRDLARDLRRSPSTVSEVLAALRKQDLISSDGLPVLPDLFWATADAWHPPAAPLADLPRPGAGPVNSALQLGFEDIAAQTGWALTDTMAAAAYGAPIGARSDHPPDFYVPTQEVLRRAVRLLGVPSDAAHRRAAVRVAPVPVICRQRVDPTNQDADPDGWGTVSEHWPLASPLFVALDLARDPGRGREVLEAWQPPQPWHRVW